MVFAPILREVSALHPSKLPRFVMMFSFPTTVSTVAGMTSDSMLSHPPKASKRMVFTPSSMITSLSFLQSLNAPRPMVSMPLLMVTLVRSPPYIVKASSAISTILIFLFIRAGMLMSPTVLSFGLIRYASPPSTFCTNHFTPSTSYSVQPCCACPFAFHAPSAKSTISAITRTNCVIILSNFFKCIVKSAVKVSKVF